MIDEVTIKLMAKIMQEGMTGIKIAALLNDANRRFNFYKGNFLPPGQTQERKELYAQKWLSALKEKGWDQSLLYIANQLLDKTRVYFAEDETHPYPQELINRLKEKIKGTRSKEEKKSRKQVIHGKKVRALLEGIKNKELSELLYQDIKDIELCISVGAWKPALVLCGSVLEAIFSDWLETVDVEEIKKAFQELYPNKKFKKIQDFSLEELIDVVEKVGRFDAEFYLLACRYFDEKLLGISVTLGDLLLKIVRDPMGYGYDYVEKGIPYYRVDDLQCPFLGDDRTVFISIDNHKKLQKTMLKNGDIIMAVRGSTIGRLRLYCGKDNEGNISPNVIILRPKRKESSAYIYCRVFINKNR